VQAADFDVGAELDRMRRDSPRTGAIASFLGLVRDLNDERRVGSMFLEHYPGMTERAIADIVEEARGRWDLHEVTVIHRVGELAPTDRIVLVAVGSPHRGDAFQACEFVMDFLKTRAPFWKKEATEGGPRWVDSRASDDTAAGRWGVSDST
jgi:molybdopterin synthase catalytic subunit